MYFCLLFPQVYHLLLLDLCVGGYYFYNFFLQIPLEYRVNNHASIDFNYVSAKIFSSKLEMKSPLQKPHCRTIKLSDLTTKVFSRLQFKNF